MPCACQCVDVYRLHGQCHLAVFHLAEIEYLVDKVEQHPDIALRYLQQCHDFSFILQLGHGLVYRSGYEVEGSAKIV